MKAHAVRRLALAAAHLCLVAGAGRPAAATAAEPPANEPPAEPALAAPPQAPARSIVYSVHRADAIRQFVADPEEVHSMVDRLVIAVTGKDTVAAAWRSLVTPKDIVGIKISATGHASGATHRAVIERIVEGLLEAGVPRENLLVWDRDANDLRLAGYLERDGKTSAFICPVSGIEPRRGYDPQDVYSAPYLGKLIWGDLLFKGEPVPADDLSSHAGEAPVNPFARQASPSPSAAASPLPNGKLKMPPLPPEENLSSVSHYCTIIAKRVTKIVNVPVFVDNEYAGVGGALYNVTIPNVDNWRRLVGPPQYGASTIPEMYSDPQVGGRVILNITDGLVAQFAGGPDFQPLYARNFGTLYASKDAVALDAIVLRYLEIWRKETQLPPIGDAAAHVKLAAELGLGNFAVDRIELHALTP